jgi:two-component system response regulator FixJ
MKQSRADTLGSADSAIFIVDDDPAVRDSLQQLLESIGFTVETYGSGESFLEHASPLEGACVLLDLKLPGLNGLEVLESLAQRPYDTSVVLITGHGDSKTRARALRAGAVAMLQKPVRDELLLRTLRRIMKLREIRGGEKT